MLGGKGAADGGRLHGSQQEAGKRERQQGIDVGPVDLGKAQGWQTLGHLTQKLDALGIEAEKRRGHDATDDHKERHGFVLQKDLSQNEHRECRKPDRERSGIGLVQMARK